MKKIIFSQRMHRGQMSSQALTVIFCIFEPQSCPISSGSSVLQMAHGSGSGHGMAMALSPIFHSEMMQRTQTTTISNSEHFKSHVLKSLQKLIC